LFVPHLLHFIIIDVSGIFFSSYPDFYHLNSITKMRMLRKMLWLKFYYDLFSSIYVGAVLGDFPPFISW
jgi:hypothetical protein